MKSGIVALIPVKTGPARGCEILYASGARQLYYCSVERYMNMMAGYLGNDNRACRRLFHEKRGTGVRLNDGSLFAQMKLSREKPTLGYVLVPAITGLLPDEEGRCILYFGAVPLQTYWKVSTASRHLALVKKVLRKKEIEECRVY